MQRLARRGHCVRRHARVKTRASRSAPSSVKRGRTRGLSADVPTRSRARAPVSRAWITGTNPVGEIDSGRVPNTRTSLEKMPKVRARHRGDALATATGERAPSPATSRSRAAIYALERLELRSTRSFRRVRGASIRSAFSGTPRENRDPRGKCFRRFGDRAPRRARRPPRARRDRFPAPALTSFVPDLAETRRRPIQEPHPRGAQRQLPLAHQRRREEGTDETLRGRSTVALPRSADLRAVSTGEIRGRRLTVALSQFPSRGFHRRWFFWLFFVSRPNDDTDRTSPNLNRALRTRE